MSIQIEENIAYSKLVMVESTNPNTRDNRPYILTMIESTKLRQTTVLMSSVCKELKAEFFLTIKSDANCKEGDDYQSYKKYAEFILFLIEDLNL